ncbi:MAG: phosphoglycerate dehydrogenase [Patescibacteria group bacterium]|nr:phosphoglycerate dehydrogenase [Patescibacteria group bacterium]
MKEVYYIIDFDSTFVRVEALDELARRALADNPDRAAIQAEIEKLTKQGMEGKIDFRDSLAQRLYLFRPTRAHIEDLILYLKRQVTKSIKANKAFFRANAGHIYIISGGFREYIVPVVAAYGIAEDHVLANEFQFRDDTVIGFNDRNPLSRSRGKAIAVKKLKLNGEIIVLGDGMADAEIKKGKAASIFYAFTENVRREAVVSIADAEIPSFDEFLFRRKIPASVSYPKNRMKVLLLEKIDKLAADCFRAEGFDVETINSALDEDELSARLADVSILGIRSKTKVTGKALRNAKKLIAIGAYCIGTNQIDLSGAAKAGVAVFNAPYSNTRSVVELVLGEILVLCRGVCEKSRKMHAGIWDKSAAGAHEVRGRKLGIVGYGNIGSQLSVLAESLGMEVWYYDREEKLALGNARKCASLSELLKKSDIITVHVDGRAENAGMIGAREFKAMKNGSIFLNSSRGHIVDIEALATALKSGKLAGAAVDVFPNEPKNNDEHFDIPLQNLPNVILTPHIGGSTEEAQRNIAEFVTKRLLLYVNQGDTTLSVNFPNLQLPPLRNCSRIIHLHANLPGILAQINNVIAAEQVNVEGQYLKTNESVGYVIIDVNTSHAEKLVKKLKAIPDTIRVRILY